MYCFFNCCSIHWTVLLFFQRHFIRDSDISRAPSSLMCWCFMCKCSFPAIGFFYFFHKVVFNSLYSISRMCLILTSFHVVNIILQIGFFPSPVRVLWEILQDRIFGLMLFYMCIALKSSLCRKVTPTSYLGQWSSSIWADTGKQLLAWLGAYHDFQVGCLRMTCIYLVRKQSWFSAGSPCLLNDGLGSVLLVDGILKQPTIMVQDLLVIWGFEVPFSYLPILGRSTLACYL